jgi:hypothetical protein
MHAQLPIPLNRSQDSSIYDSLITMESGEMQNVNATPSAVNDSGEVNPMASKKQLAAEQKAQKEVHLLHLIEGTTWKNLDSYTVEDNVLKQMMGFDPAVFSVDMLCKICGKLGYMSHNIQRLYALKPFLRATKIYKHMMQSSQVATPMLTQLVSDADCSM